MDAQPPPFAAVEARRPAPVSRLSYSALSSFKACGYRFYAERVLGLPRPDRAELGPPPKPRAEAVEEATGQWALAPGEEPSPAVPSGLSALDRGSVVHELLERIEFSSRACRPPRRCARCSTRARSRPPTRTSSVYVSSSSPSSSRSYAAASRRPQRRGASCSSCSPWTRCS